MPRPRSMAFAASACSRHLLRHGTCGLTDSIARLTRCTAVRRRPFRRLAVPPHRAGVDSGTARASTSDTRSGEQYRRLEREEARQVQPARRRRPLSCAFWTNGSTSARQRSAVTLYRCVSASQISAGVAGTRQPLPDERGDFVQDEVLAGVHVHHRDVVPHRGGDERVVANEHGVGGDHGHDYDSHEGERSWDVSIWRALTSNAAVP